MCKCVRAACWLGWFTLVHVQVAAAAAAQGLVQQQFQPNYQEVILTSVSRAILNLEYRLHAKISDLLDAKIANLLETRLSQLLDAKLGVVNNDVSQIDNTLLDFNAEMASINRDVDGLKHHGNVLNESIKEIKAHGAAILEEIKEMKQERNLFFSLINNLIVNSNQMSTKIDNINNQLNQVIKTINVPVDEIMSQGNTMIEEIKLVKDDGSSRNSILSKLSSKVEAIETEVKTLRLGSSQTLSLINNTLKCSVNEVAVLDTFTKELNNRMESLNASYDELKLQGREIQKEICRSREGFFMSNGSQQCFKFFNDERRYWIEGKTKCEEEGLLLAEPSDAVVVALRKDIIDTYGDVRFWVGARSDGSQFTWLSNGMVLRSDSPRWYSSAPGQNVGTDRCLEVLATKSIWRSSPGRMYFSAPCTQWQYTLCEVNME